MYTPGKGLIPGVLGAATGAAATQLPQTGGSVLNDVALAVAGAMIAWAVVYMRVRKHNRNESQA